MSYFGSCWMASPLSDYERNPLAPFSPITLIISCMASSTRKTSDRLLLNGKLKEIRYPRSKSNHTLFLIHINNYRSTATILSLLSESISVESMYIHEFVSVLYDMLILPTVKLTSTNDFTTKSMTWFGYARNLILELGYEGDSVMNSTSWHYAIAEGLKSANIDIVPGIYRKRPSYSKIIRLRRESFKRGAINLTIHHACSANLKTDILSFTLPLTTVPTRFTEWCTTFLSRNPSVGRSAENSNAFRQRQNIVRRLTQSLNLNHGFDYLLVIYATLLSLRKPLPYTINGHRKKQWSNLTIGAQSVDIYATGIVCVGLYYKYPELRQPGPDEMDWNDFRKKLGTTL